MAILNIQTLPGNVTLDQVQEVDAAVMAEGPPIGGVSHVIIDDGGQIRIYDVWESEEAMNTFVQERLVPLIMKQMGVSDPSQLPMPESQIFEVATVMSVTYGV